MKRLVLLLMAAVVLLGITQVCAWAGVRVSWTDANGSQYVDLVQVPINPGDPLYVDFAFAWYGVLNVTMATGAPILFTASGSYSGDLGDSYAVWLDQNVLNNTGSAWNAFHITIPNEDAFFGAMRDVHTWSTSQNDYSIDFVDAGAGVVAPGQAFHDGIRVIDFDQWPPDMTADFTLAKYPTLVPEAGSLAVLLTGIGGMTALVRRRKL